MSVSRKSIGTTPTTPTHGRRRSSSGSNHSATSPRSSPKLTRKNSGDRFIPSRSDDADMLDFKLKENTTPNRDAPDHYKTTLADTLFDSPVKTSRVLNFNDEVLISANENSPLRGGDLFNTSSSDLLAGMSLKPQRNRYVPTTADRVLDAPDLLDDYYLNLLDWSHENIIAIGLGNAVYLWNAQTGDSSELFHTDESNHITSLAFSKEGSYIAVGLNDSKVQIWDVCKSQMLRAMGGHSARVSALDWNSYVVSSGSRDSTIINHDVRISDHAVTTMSSHNQEVCGLKWSHDGTHLASGSNDNLLNIWSPHNSSPLFSFDHHQAAVKALAWCPWQPHLLASGGGTADRTIRFWNTQEGKCTKSVDTNSQVCAISWSHTLKELVSSHGYSQNQLIVWKYANMSKVAELRGHTSRVLHMAQSPDHTTIATAAGDETLRFWKVFESKEPATKKKGTQFSPQFAKSMISIR